MEQKAWNAKRVGMVLFGFGDGRKRFAVRYGVLITEQSKGVERPHHDGLAA